MQELTRSLDLNSQVMVILANKFLRLAQEDRIKIEEMIGTRYSRAFPAC
jgi:hypothetical protein